MGNKRGDDPAPSPKEDTMKRLIFAAAIVLMFGAPAQAHMEEGPMGHGMMMGGEQMPMMEHMKAHGMMMGEMMDMMKNIITMQKRIVAGVKASEKKELEKELSAMLEKVETMTSGMKGMMSQGMMMQGMLGGTASAETALTADLLEKEASLVVNACTDCHARADQKPKLLPEIPSLKFEGAAEATVLNNQQAFHHNCGDCHDAVVKARPSLDPAPPTSKKCTA